MEVDDVRQSNLGGMEDGCSQCSAEGLAVNRQSKVSISWYGMAGQGEQGQGQ